ncbi:MAG: hypothetical protein ACTSRE_08750 [Promethearchaeota archaeon]
MSDENNPDVIKVSEVREEYTYVQAQKCDKCGLLGTYTVEMQRLVENLGVMCDELDCVCSGCGAKKTFVFNVSKLFEEYANMFKSKL